MIELRGEGLVVRQHQRRAADALDHLGHRERLAGAGDAQQNLMLLAVAQAARQFRDGGLLIAARLVVDRQSKAHIYSDCHTRPLLAREIAPCDRAMFSADPLESARKPASDMSPEAGDASAGQRCGKGFRLFGPDGRTLATTGSSHGSASLVIPPAWKNVWICPTANGHIQAVGWDAKGRKQYRYHAQYRTGSRRGQIQPHDRLRHGAGEDPQRVKEDLALRGLPREKVLATVVRLLETTYIRVGNDEYAKENDSFGLTTMRNRHVRIDRFDPDVPLPGQERTGTLMELTDRKLTRIVSQCMDLPGYELFEYLDEAGQVCRIDSADVNEYLREAGGQDFTAKDFRTWTGSILAARELNALGPASSDTAAKKAIVAAVKSVAQQLGNRPATCRKYYIHPAILESYSGGTLFEVMQRGEEQHAAYSELGLRPEEYACMVIIADHQIAKAA